MADSAHPRDQEPPDIAVLVAEHGSVLYRYAYRLSGSAADAEDLTQQVFLTALGKLQQLRDPAAVRAWLCAVLRRAHLRQIRNRHPQPATNVDIDINIMAIDLAEEGSRFDEEELQQALDELPDAYKLVVVGFYFEDCSYKELAERLELPIGTVMSRLSRAKGFLRAKLLARETTSNETTKPCKAGNGEPVHAADRVRGEAS